MAISIDESAYFASGPFLNIDSVLLGGLGVLGGSTWFLIFRFDFLAVR